MRNDKSMLDEAYDIVLANNDQISFLDLINKVAENLEMTDEEKNARLGGFYTDLSLDGRFVALTDNYWDLRARHTYDKVHIDYNEVYSDSAEEEQDPEELEGEEGEGEAYGDYDDEDEDRRKGKVDLEGTGIREEDL